MRTLSSLLFAVLTSLSAAAYAAPVSMPATGTPPAAVMGTKVNLNTADAETLRRELSGIGDAKAQAIVAHREAHGKFASVDEMLEVTGIGKSLLDRNIEKLTVE
ncbi:helix-hairpin-helix domain-containing protein [Pseudomonas sp. dw_358]|uniref:ComEA family DNA-binding protein n=1 Tax=Pseudomonas sp. dw_358 TaxID=2720083 RepID=UPI001BD2734F|nr:helix-hairpin-helix domain-containing protein [Pseudomonas sp. dw_358]